MAAKRSASKKKTARKKPAAKGGKAAKSPRKKSSPKNPTAKKPGGKPSNEPPKEKVETDAGTDAKVQQIQAIIDVMLAAGAVELETDDGQGGRLRVRLKEEIPPNIVTTAMSPAPIAISPTHAHAPAPAPAESDDSVEVLASPMVGTFYRAPSPEAESFVSVGDTVDDDSTICVIEAMKVMNEIKAEMNGNIVEVLVENGEPVEFGQPLFRVTRS
jgi:acetyl-CoA carboxylase biotin carboxyl carrier protein